MTENDDGPMKCTELYFHFVRKHLAFLMKALNIMIIRLDDCEIPHLVSKQIIGSRLKC